MSIYPVNETPKPEFQVIDGGLALPKTAEARTSDNWLANLPPDSVFLTRPKARYLASLGQFAVVGHSPKGVGTYLKTPEGHDEWVDNARFSNQMDFVALIYNGTNEQRSGPD